MKKALARQGKPVPFHKLHGAGNDILVVRSVNLPKGSKPAFFRRMAHRQLGVGSDQIMEVTSTRPLAVQIWNGDGSRAEMCANGLRVVLYLAAREGWIAPKAKEVSVSVGKRKFTALKKGAGYEVALGVPEVGPLELLPLNRDSIPFYPVSVGNPHAVVLFGNGESEWNGSSYSLQQTGPALETHLRFPRKTNVEFVRKIEIRKNLAIAQVDIWERGAGATLSCGSGAVAVAAVVRKLHGLSRVDVKMTDYTLKVRFEGEKACLSGPSALIASGLYFP